MIMKKKDLFYLMLILALLFVFMYIILNIYSKIFDIDKDNCISFGFCKFGQEINTEYGKIKIDKRSCLKYNWNWIEEQNSCNIR